MEELCLLLNWLTSLLFDFIILLRVDVTSSCSLTMSCVKVEMSTVELSGFLITRRPSLGWRITVNVITRLEVLLMSLVTTCKSSFVMGVEEPGGKTWNWIKKNYQWSELDNQSWSCLWQEIFFFLLGIHCSCDHAIKSLVWLRQMLQVFPSGSISHLFHSKLCKTSSGIDRWESFDVSH